MCQGQELHPDPQDASDDDPYMNLDESKIKLIKKKKTRNTQI